jgi:hypothetical protein
MLARSRRPDREAQIEIRGRSDGQPWVRSCAIGTAAAASLEPIWARQRLRDLEDRKLAVDAASRGLIAREIIETSLRHRVLCSATAYVAVDRAEIANPEGRLHAVVQPIELPARWEEPSGHVDAMRLPRAKANDDGMRYCMLSEDISAYASDPVGESLNKEKNFFESRVTEYQSGSKLNWETSSVHSLTMTLRHALRDLCRCLVGLLQQAGGSADLRARLDAIDWHSIEPAPMVAATSVVLAAMRILVQLPAHASAPLGEWFQRNHQDILAAMDRAIRIAYALRSNVDRAGRTVEAAIAGRRNVMAAILLYLESLHHLSAFVGDKDGSHDGTSNSLP